MCLPSTDDPHADLGVRKDFSDWIKVQIKRAMLVENQDFIAVPQKGDGGKFAPIEYHLTIEAGKHMRHAFRHGPRQSGARLFPGLREEGQGGRPGGQGSADRGRDLHPDAHRRHGAGAETPGRGTCPDRGERCGHRGTHAAREQALHRVGLRQPRRHSDGHQDRRHDRAPLRCPVAPARAGHWRRERPALRQCAQLPRVGAA
ncbi:MAG: antA/AntB antirepressor family protein [Betaproteobacteria bacterium]|nr:antA/AntB antirepressor family protein [Betaproteobacteria bacterium]